MRFHKGDMWSAYDEADLFLVTANSFVKKDGRLVMGAGIAKEALDKFPNIDLRLGQAIQFEDKHLSDAKVHLNFPGIGMGRLNPASVIPIIVWLPDSVTIWRKE